VKDLAFELLGLNVAPRHVPRLETQQVVDEWHDGGGLILVYAEGS
jgi:hypothetical protein